MKPMKIFNNLSVKLKLTVSCVSVVILSVLVFAAVIFARSSMVVTRLAERNVEQVMLSATQHIQTLIDDINSSLLSFQTKDTVQTILSDSHRGNPIDEVTMLENSLREIDVFQSKILKSELYVLNRDDYPQLNSSQFVFSERQLRNDSWFNTMRHAGNTTKWIIRDAENSNYALIVASKLIHDVNTQKPVAILKANIDMRNFTDYLNAITLADTGKMFLCSANHVVNSSNSALGRKLVNNTVIFNDMLKSRGIETRTITLDRENWLIKSYPLGSTGMFLVGTVKINEFSAAQSGITAAILITAVLLSILSLALILFISSLITRPLSVLTGRMNNYNVEHNNTLHSDSKDEIGVLFESFNSMNDTIHALIENVNREMEIRKMAELKALQAQITPHFLYNTLNSISALSKSYGAKDIEKMTVALSRFFMNSLNNGAELITIGNELDQVMSYVYLQKIRYGDRFDVRIIADNDVKQYLICKLTLQPLVENCIYHAFRDIDYTGHVIIKAVHDGGKIIITVTDNGIGNYMLDFRQMNEYVNKSFDLNEPIEKYGIHNISQRIKLYFGEDCGLCYYPNADEGITVRITLTAVKAADKNNRNGGKTK